MRPKNVLPFAVLCTVPFILVLGNSMLIPVLPRIRSALHLTQAQTGLFITAFSIPAGLAIMLVGALSDRIGRKRVIAPSLIVYGAGGIAAALAAILVERPYWLILAARVIQGVGAAGTGPIATAVAGDMFQSQERTRAVGILEASNGFGKVISPVLGAGAALVAWWAPFLLFAVVAFPAAIGVWALCPEPAARDRDRVQNRDRDRDRDRNRDRDRDRGSGGGRSSGKGAASSEDPAPGDGPGQDQRRDQSGDQGQCWGQGRGRRRRQTSMRTYFADLRRVFKEKGWSLAACYVAGAVVLLVLFGMLFYFSDVLEDRFKIGGLMKGLLIAAPILVMSVTSLLAGLFLEKHGTLLKTATWAGLALVAASLGLLAFGSGLVWLGALTAVIGFGSGLVLPSLNTMVTSAAGGQTRGMVTSVYGAVRFLGVAAGPPVFGLIMDSRRISVFGPAAVAAGAAALFVVLALDQRLLAPPSGDR